MSTSFGDSHDLESPGYLFWDSLDHLLIEFAPETQNAGDIKYKGMPNSGYQQVLMLADLHVVSRDVSG